jgi:hypothetical protein
VVERSANGIKAHNIEKMGDALGLQYSALWQEVAAIHFQWGEFKELFHEKKSRVDLLNQSAGSFFRMVQDSLWEGTILHVARLTDPPHTGSKDRSNLSVQNLPDLIDDPGLKTRVTALAKNAVTEAAFCRDWRNRHIAHRDLRLALDATVEPLAEASVKKVDGSLESIVAIMNAVDGHYCESETRYDLGKPHHGAISLLYVLDDGIKAAEARSKRLESGAFTQDDFRARDL